jgi:hypothetical protein
MPKSRKIPPDISEKATKKAKEKFQSINSCSIPGTLDWDVIGIPFGSAWSIPVVSTA